MLTADVLRLLGFSRGKRKPDREARLAAIDWPKLNWLFLTSWAGERWEIAPGVDLGADDWLAIIDPETGRQREIKALDPAYGTRRSLSLWYLSHGENICIFAADEVSNGIWIIFVPKAAAQDQRQQSGERQ